MELQSYQRRTWAEIDLDAVERNYNSLKGIAPEGVKICCVVKADGYGHGAVELSRHFERLGAEWLAVSNVEEGMALREAGISCRILVLGYTPTSAAEYLARYDISQCVSSLDYAKELSAALKKAGAGVKIHIKLDTGMGRLGFSCKSAIEGIEGDREGAFDAAIDEIKQACCLDGLRAEGIFTHLCCADEGEDGEAYTVAQIESFKAAVGELSALGIEFPIKHASASSGFIDYPWASFDMVRCGISLYGILPSESIRNKVGLFPAMKLKTVVSQVKELKAGEYVSYGRRFKAESDIMTATLPVGYADGFYRRNSEVGGAIEINGKPARIIGRVCMDQCVVDVSEIEGVKVGDEAIVFGGIISASRLAEMNDTIPYEVLCSLSQRIPRVYLSRGKIVSVVDYLL